MSSKIMLVAAGAAVVVGGILISFLFKEGTPKAAQAATGAADTKTEAAAPATPASTDAPAMSKEVVVLILKDITTKAQGVIMQLAQLEQELRRSAAQRGATLTEQQLQEYLMSNFAEAMDHIEKQVFQKHEVTEAAVQHASDFYQEDADVKEAAAEFKRLLQVITGQPMEKVDLPEWVTVGKVIEVIAETMEGMNITMEKVFADMKAEGLTQGTPAFDQALQERYVTGIKAVREEVNNKHKMDEQLMQQAVYQYKEDPSFGAKMAELTQEQQQRFAALGIQTSG